MVRYSVVYGGGSGRVGEEPYVLVLWYHIMMYGVVVWCWQVSRVMGWCSVVVLLLLHGVVLLSSVGLASSCGAKVLLNLYKSYTLLFCRYECSVRVRSDQW